MVKSKPSMTGKAATPAGGYPKSMDSLIDEHGHISLRRQDYDGYSEEDVKRFVSAQPYEVNVLFTPDGEVIRLFSQYSSSSVSINIVDYEAAVRTVQLGTGKETGYVDFHNHPIDAPGIVEIWSPGDIDDYVRQSKYYDLTSDSIMYGASDNYHVRSSLGHEFKLEFDKSIRSPFRNSDQFATDYEQEMNDVIAEVQNRRRNGIVTTAEGAAEVTSKMDSWLARNARDYGFRYTSNW